MKFAAYITVGTVLVSLPLYAQGTVRVSVDSAGAQGNENSYGGIVSLGGGVIAFASSATNLVASDTNGFRDVFVRDLAAGTTTRVTHGPGGVQANGDSTAVALTPDGRFVVFLSWASNLVAGDTNAAQDTFVHDRLTGTTERIDIDSGGAQANESCTSASISADGNFVAFASFASNLVTGDTNAVSDIFVRDRAGGTTVRVSVDSAGAQANAFSQQVASSADGRWVSFCSGATNLVPGDTNQTADVFVRDLQTGTTERVSLGPPGVQGNSGSARSSMSADGRYVAFESSASNLVLGDGNNSGDVFVRDRLSATTRLASVDSTGMVGNSLSALPSISSDGQCVAFLSLAANLVPNDTNSTWDVFVHDLVSGGTDMASLGLGGSPADDSSQAPMLSGEGRFVCFPSSATNLVPGDTNQRDDTFVHDRLSSAFTLSCEPGSNGTISCPCFNAPSGPGRGCDNSAATGGAALAVSGVSLVSADSVVFTTSGEMPSATSILLQGDAANHAGQVLGQGVRCVSGALKRLYVKSAVGGSITAPDLASGDPTVTLRSAALGDPIVPVTTRWYMVYYRDPTVMNGCPATSTYNASETVSIRWWP